MITQKRSKRKSRLLLPPGVISSKLLASLPVPGSCLRPSPTSSRKERRRFKTRGPAKRRGHSRSSWSPSSPARAISPRLKKAPKKPDVIIIAPTNPEAMVPLAKKAKASGIKVMTYDADVADHTARQWFVNQGTFTQAGAALVDVVAEQAGASARFAVVSTDPGAFSQNSWIAAIKAQMQAKYPKMQLVDIRYGLGKPAESFSVAQDLINKFQGQLDAIVAPTVVALPKVAEAVEQAGLTGKIVITGMSTPKDMKEFVKRGTVKTFVLWNPVDLGYLAVYVAQASLAGTLKDNATEAKVPAGRLGTRDAVASLEDITAKGPLTLKNVIVLGDSFRFTMDNIDQFNF